ncbi:hypothetical protein OROHE_002723 [Orobanche hederae]
MLIDDLLAEAARIRQAKKCRLSEEKHGGIRHRQVDIKERWVSRRQNARRHSRKRSLFFNEKLNI